MAIKIFDALGVVRLDTKGLKNGLKDAKSIAAKGIASIGAVLKKGAKIAAVSIAAIGAAITAATVAIAKLGTDVIESENLFEVSLGKMAEAARNWSIELSKALGLNQFEIRKTLGRLNNMLVAMGLNEKAALDMSQALVKLGFDMASFFNIKPEEAFLKIEAGIVGEIEPLRRLGIVLTQATLQNRALKLGIEGQIENMTEAQKVMLRFAEITKQTTRIQGDMERTLGTAANQMRVFRERMIETASMLGLKMQPAVDATISVLNLLATRFSETVTQNSESIERFFVAVAGVIGSAMEDAVEEAVVAVKEADKTLGLAEQLTANFSEAQLAALAKRREKSIAETEKFNTAIAQATANAEADIAKKSTESVTRTKEENLRIIRAFLNDMLQTINDQIGPIAKVGADLGIAFASAFKDAVAIAIGAGIDRFLVQPLRALGGGGTMGFLADSPNAPPSVDTSIPLPASVNPASNLPAARNTSFSQTNNIDANGMTPEQLEGVIGSSFQNLVREERLNRGALTA